MRIFETETELARGGIAICVRLLSGTWPAWPICLAKLTEECSGGGSGRVVRESVEKGQGQGQGKGMFGAGFRFVRAVVHQ